MMPNDYISMEYSQIGDAFLKSDSNIAQEPTLAPSSMPPALQLCQTNFTPHRFREEGAITTGIPVFPWQLHDMLLDAEKYGFAHVVSWEDDGHSFKVHERDAFISDILPKYFQGQTKYKSFQRQLNMYGFRMIAKGCHKGAYSHDLLERGKAELCRFMKRACKSKKQGRSASSENLKMNLQMEQKNNHGRSSSSLLPLHGRGASSLSDTALSRMPQQQSRPVVTLHSTHNETFHNGYHHDAPSSGCEEQYTYRRRDLSPIALRRKLILESFKVMGTNNSYTFHSRGSFPLPLPPYNIPSMQANINAFSNDQAPCDHLSTIGDPESLDDIFESHCIDIGGTKPVFAASPSCTGVLEDDFEPIHLPMW